MIIFNNNVPFCQRFNIKYVAKGRTKFWWHGNNSDSLCRWFRLLNLPKGKSLGRSKPETNSYAQALATHCVGFLLYPSSSELPYAT
jgi:hypothetical protein